MGIKPPVVGHHSTIITKNSVLVNGYFEIKYHFHIIMSLTYQFLNDILSIK